ncbi:hypothetical protein ACGF12_28615 [Kitasatospora sp. NPDC048296]|uniref:hypothetical protein n=1 Tax=Kitasatospora sp. NPDC048296 TaxID=3364048 RepID=UPI00371F2073
MAADRGAVALHEALVERLAAATARSGGERATTAALARIVAALAGAADAPTTAPSSARPADPGRGCSPSVRPPTATARTSTRRPSA